MKILKWITAAVLGLALLAGIAFGGAVWMGDRKRQRVVDVRVAPVAYVSDTAVLQQGKYLFESRGCAECHGANGTGRVFIDAPNGLFVRSPNLTGDPGSAVARYKEVDWVRAIRHGVNPQGRALLVMPSEDYNRLTDADLAALVAYVRSLPPQASQPGEVRLPVFLRALYGAGVIPDAYSRIDHALPPAQPVAVGATTEHGAYVTNMCQGCHGHKLAGGPIPGAPPEWPPAANLTPGAGGAMARYPTLDRFVAMMRTGKRPDGTAVSTVMPFATLAAINDVDLQAMYAYLKTLAPQPTGAR